MIKTKSIFGFFLFVAFYAQAVVLRPAIVPRYSGAEIGEWTMDHEAALAKAAAGTNNVVVMFTGAWWCPHCQALERTVLTNEAWQAYVQSNKLYLVMVDNPGRADQYWCWLRETNYVESVGLTLEQGEAEITNHYALQTSYAVPGAPTNTVRGVSYLRVGYPTLIGVRPDGRTLGRFSPLATTVSTEQVLRNLDQIWAADPGDEQDDYYQGASLLQAPLCEDEEVAVGVRSLSETDAADWYAFDASAGVQWSFVLRAAEAGTTNDIKVQIFSDPASTNSEVERTMAPSDLSVLSYVVPHAGRYWLKISRVQTLRQRVPYRLGFWYGTSSATVLFAAPQVTVSENAAAVSLTVNIFGASEDAEIHVSYETSAGSAKPGQDYVESAGELIWGAGAKQAKTFSIPLLPDAVWEGDETFTVALYAVRNCSVGEQLSACTVVLKEQAPRQAGKLGFAGMNAVVLTEGSNAVFQVLRTEGDDGAVTAQVEHVEGTVRIPVAQLVWTNGEMTAKAFGFAFASEPGFQKDSLSKLVLSPQGGAALKSAAAGTLALTRRDDLMVQTLADYAAGLAGAFSLQAMRGIWFHGYWSDAERDSAWLRSAPVAPKDSVALSCSLQGPGVLGFDWRLEGQDATMQCQIGTAVAMTMTNAGLRAGDSLALPAGKQKAMWSVRRLGASEVFGGVRNLVWCPVPQAVGPAPQDKAAVIYRGTTLAWQDVLAGLAVPAGAAAHYEVFAGADSRSLVKWSEQVEAAFPRAGNAPDRAALDELVAKAASKALFWRVDTVLTDAQGRRVVYAGSTWSINALPEGSPEFVAAGGAYDPTVPGGVRLPLQTVGVAGEVGPFAVANAAGGTLRVAVKNGALPKGMSASVRDGAVWITGVPQRAGSGAVDLHLNVVHQEGGTAVAESGSSLTVAWDVQLLGRVAGQYEGFYEKVWGEVGYGDCSFAVTASGRISGRFVHGAIAYSVSKSAFDGFTNGVFFADMVAQWGTNAVPTRLYISPNGLDAELWFVGEQDGYYALRRNNWKDSNSAALLTAYIGYYSVALPVIEKSSLNAPGGTGYLTFTVKANGTVSYAGHLADGKQISGSAPLLYGPDCCSAGNRVTFYLLSKPSGYLSGTGLYGLFYLEPKEVSDAGGVTVQPGDLVAGVRWVNSNPKSVFGYNPTTGELPAGIPGFTNVLDVTGGYYGEAVNLQAYYGAATLMIQSDFAAPADYDGEQGVSGYGLVSLPEPARLPAMASGAASLAFPQQVLVKSGTLVDFDASVNPWSMSVSPNRSSGIFTGSCKFYYQGLDGSGATQQKTRSVSIRGIFLPIRSPYQSYSDWMGYYLIPDVTRYLDAGGAEKSYSFNWSYDFSLSPVLTED